MSSERSVQQQVSHAERHELQQRIHAWLDVPLTTLGLVMVGLLVLDLTQWLGPHWTARVAQAETAIWAIFVLAFVVEFALAPDKVRYLKENWLTVVAVALPAFRAVRILRVARALRGLSLLRIITTLNRGMRALGNVVSRGQFGYVLALTSIVCLLGAAGGYYFEQGEPGANITTPGAALWWSATIITTINSPFGAVSLEGRILGFLLRVFALGVSGYVTAVIAVYLLGTGESAAPKVAQAEELHALHAEVRHLRRLLEASLPADAWPDGAPDEPRAARRDPHPTGAAHQPAR